MRLPPWGRLVLLGDAMTGHNLKDQKLTRRDVGVLASNSGASASCVVRLGDRICGEPLVQS